MRSCFVTFRSVTYAQRGEKALRAVGIGCVLQRTPRVLEERGCGYNLSIYQSDVERAVVVLRQSQIPFRKVYCRQADGTMGEVAV